MDNVIVVLTSVTLNQMFEEGGSGWWKVRPYRVEESQYFIATRNGSSGLNDVPHGCAFLIGRKLGAITAPDADRYIITFEEYAEIHIENVWPGQRNPLAYTTLEALGIDRKTLDTLEWKPFPRELVKPVDTTQPLTVDEAKRGLAKSLGISPGCIEITIRA